jgi:hypothetical protein
MSSCHRPAHGTTVAVSPTKQFLHASSAEPNHTHRVPRAG